MAKRSITSNFKNKVGADKLKNISQAFTTNDNKKKKTLIKLINEEGNQKENTDEFQCYGRQKKRCTSKDVKKMNDVQEDTSNNDDEFNDNELLAIQRAVEDLRRHKEQNKTATPGKNHDNTKPNDASTDELTSDPDITRIIFGTADKNLLPPKAKATKSDTEERTSTKN